MLGGASALREALSGKNTGSFGRVALKETQNQDEKSLPRQNASCPWEILDAEEVAITEPTPFFFSKRLHYEFNHMRCYCLYHCVYKKLP